MWRSMAPCFWPSRARESGSSLLWLGSSRARRAEKQSASLTGNGRGKGRKAIPPFCGADWVETTSPEVLRPLWVRLGRPARRENSTGSDVLADMASAISLVLNQTRGRSNLLAHPQAPSPARIWHVPGLEQLSTAHCVAFAALPVPRPIQTGHCREVTDRSLRQASRGACGDRWGASLHGGRIRPDPREPPQGPARPARRNISAAPAPQGRTKASTVKNPG